MEIEQACTKQSIDLLTATGTDLGQSTWESFAVISQETHACKSPLKNTVVRQRCSCLRGQIALTSRRGLTAPSVSLPGQAVLSGQLRPRLNPCTPASPSAAILAGRGCSLSPDGQADPSACTRVPKATTSQPQAHLPAAATAKAHTGEGGQGRYHGCDSPAMCGKKSVPQSPFLLLETIFHHMFHCFEG